MTTTGMAASADLSENGSTAAGKKGSPANNVNWPQILERTAWSAIQSLAAVYIAKGTITISAGEIALLTALTALLTAVKSTVLAYVDRGKGTVGGWLEDTTARAAFTFGEVLLATLITAAVTPLTMASFKAALLAGAAAALAGVKSAFAQSMGVQSSAATLTTTADQRQAVASS